MSNVSTARATRLSDAYRQPRRCRFCSEGIAASARSCPHCGAALITGREMPSAPRVTVVGYLGIGLGVLIAGLGLVQLPTIPPDEAGYALLWVLFGIVVGFVSYSGARR